MDPVTQALRAHYAETFRAHGATARGVDWSREDDVRLRYSNMLAVVTGDRFGKRSDPSLLDVGCGFGGLLDYATAQGVPLRYTGIDVVEGMIEHAKAARPDATFHCVDVFAFESAADFDYVVCNGILTQKLSATIREMDAFAQHLIRRLFALCRRGVAFNVMSTKVNFMAPNLYYRSPVDLLAFCLSEISDHVRVDHAYPLYEYTVYVYRS